MAFDLFKEHDANFKLRATVAKDKINEDGEIERVYNYRKIEVENTKDILSSNLLFDKDDIAWYSRFNRYGYIDPYNTRSATREFLFFTKPDLNIFSETNVDYNALTLTSDLQNYPIFIDAIENHKEALTQLCLKAKNPDNTKSPFMYLLSNSVTTKLDLPSITAESKDTTSNIYGTSLQYRSHSLKSDNGYDFSLSFTDTGYLEIYHLVKLYDEYMRLIRLGEVSHRNTYITNMILPDQFSIYKFLIADDGETIKYYAKLTGVFFTDVPRSDFGDPAPDGFKFSLSFHAQFVEDNNPSILRDFNKITPASKSKSYVKVFKDGRVDNRWVRSPIVVAYADDRAKREQAKYVYRLKWVD